MTTPSILIAVGLGAALGSVARFGASMAALNALGPAYPWGTLVVNVVGSFLIGLYATLTEPGARYRPSPATRQFVLAGFCGGFTTFSIFSLESLLLLQRGTLALFVVHVLASLLLWLLAVWMGSGVGLWMNRLGRKVRS